MTDYVLSCCSTADLTEKMLDENDIHYVSFHYEIDGVDHLDDMGGTISSDMFYKLISDGIETKTSQVSVGEYVDYFKQFAMEGKDILHVCLSSGISGTYTSAQLAAKIIRDDFPDIKIIIIDSLCASSGYGLLMFYASALRNMGKSIDAVAQWIEDNKLNINHWFFSTDLSAYIRGGRISKTCGTISGVLDICPILDMDNEGHLSPYSKVRTKRKAKERIVDEMVKSAYDGEEYRGKCFISHSGCFEDARDVADMIEDKFKHLDGKVEIFDIGATIGVHTGPGTIAVFFFGPCRIEK